MNTRAKLDECLYAKELLDWAPQLEQGPAQYRALAKVLRVAALTLKDRQRSARLAETRAALAEQRAEEAEAERAHLSTTLASLQAPAISIRLSRTDRLGQLAYQWSDGQYHNERSWGQLLNTARYRARKQALNQLVAEVWQQFRQQYPTLADGSWRLRAYPCDRRGKERVVYLEREVKS